MFTYMLSWVLLLKRTDVAAALEASDELNVFVVIADVLVYEVGVLVLYLYMDMVTA